MGIGGRGKTSVSRQCQELMPGEVISFQPQRRFLEVVGCAVTPGKQAATLLTLSREAKASNLCDLDMCLLQRSRPTNQCIPMAAIFEARSFRRTSLQHVSSYLLTV